MNERMKLELTPRDLGDPALHLWTATPTNVNFFHPTTISLGTNTYEVIIIDENGTAVEGARVTLLMGNDIILLQPLQMKMVKLHYLGMRL